jgi:hypothetical protein
MREKITSSALGAQRGSGCSGFVYVATLALRDSLRRKE